MSLARFPELAELLPQKGTMRLLARVLYHEPEVTRCALDPCESALFARPDGSVPSFVALEWMAQCVAARGALDAQARGERLPPGLLLGARSLELFCDAFFPGEALEVEARPRAQSGGLLAFACAVFRPDEGEPAARGRLSVRLLEQLPDLGARG